MEPRGFWGLSEREGSELSLEAWVARRRAKGRKTVEPPWNFVLPYRHQEGTEKVPGGRITELGYHEGVEG